MGAMILALAVGALGVYQTLTSDNTRAPNPGWTQGTMPGPIATPDPTATPIYLDPTATPVSIATVTPVVTPTLLPTVTPAASPTATPTPTDPATPTPTDEPAPTELPTPTATPTATPVITPTPTPTPAPTVTPAPNPFTSGTEHITPLKPEDYSKLQMTDMPVLRIGKGTIHPDKTTFGQAYYYQGDTARLRVTIINLNDTISQETLTIKVATRLFGFWIDYPVDYTTDLNLELKTGEQVVQDFYVTVPEEIPPGFYRLTIDLNDKKDGQLICGVVKEVNILENSS